MPHLELSAALTSTHLAKVTENELTLSINAVTLWSDSTTVLYWLTTDSCRYKVLVGTRISEIQTLTSTAEWRYVDYAHNSADHITRDLTFTDIAGPHPLVRAILPFQTQVSSKHGKNSFRRLSVPCTGRLFQTAIFLVRQLIMLSLLNSSWHRPRLINFHQELRL